MTFPGIGWNVVGTARIQIIRPPLYYCLTRLQMFRFVDIGHAHDVVLLMAHLAFHRILRPQTGFHQDTAGYRAEAVSADILFSVVTN